MKNKHFNIQGKIIWAKSIEKAQEIFKAYEEIEKMRYSLQREKFYSDKFANATLR